MLSEYTGDSNEPKARLARVHHYPEVFAEGTETAGTLSEVGRKAVQVALQLTFVTLCPAQ